MTLLNFLGEDPGANAAEELKKTDGDWDALIKGVASDPASGMDGTGKIIQPTGKFIPSDPGFADNMAQYVSPKTAKVLADASRNIPDARRCTPPSYQEYIKYPHRNSYDMYNLRIGDCCFVLPPEFISVKTLSSTDSKVAIRQDSQIKTKNGYYRKEIVVTLYLNGPNQINGYMVDSPMDYKYYVDGLRPLLAEFKCTPFLPVENEFLNGTCEIYNVALSSLAVSLVPGFPECLQVNLIMQEFNAVPYIENYNIFYDDYIDWDMFRFYYQQLIRSDCKFSNKLTPISNGTSLTGNFSFSTLKLEALTEENMDMFDPSSFNKVISNDEGIEITDISFNLSNILPVIQLSDHSSPTHQYFGGMDTVFSITLETLDKEIATKFTSMNTMTQLMVRRNKNFNGLGFIRIENEIINLTGTHFFMIDNMIINTVPEFPGLISITMECVSFDSTQSGREKLIGMRPFEEDKKGTKNDALSQNLTGIGRKAKQDTVIEKKLMQMELYPDLHLPLYTEVNSAIKNIITFRNKNVLTQIGYTEYPKSFSIVPGVGPNGFYSKYMEPDFYVFYPMKYKDIDDSAFDVMKAPRAPVASSVVIPDIDWGDELPQGSTVSKEGTISYFDATYVNGTISYEKGGIDTSAVLTSASIKSFVYLAISKIGLDYVWGAYGTGTPQSFDCSGFVCHCLDKVGLFPKGQRTNCDGLWSRYIDPIKKEQLKAGDLLFRGGDHVAIYVSENKTVEAMGSKWGVCYGKINGRSWTRYGRIKGFLPEASPNSSSASRSYDAAAKAAGLSVTPAKVTNASINAETYSASTATTNSFNGYATGTKKISSQVEALRPTISTEAAKIGLSDKVNLILALIQQEAGGSSYDLANDPMQSAESQGMSAGSLHNVALSIRYGLAHFKKVLTESKGNIPLCLQSYNFGSGFISYINKRGGVVSQALVNAFSLEQAKKAGWSSYGDKQYIQHVLQYYSGTETFSGIEYVDNGNSEDDVIPVSTFVFPKLTDAGELTNNGTGEYSGENFGKPIYSESPVLYAEGEKKTYNAKQEVFNPLAKDIFGLMCTDAKTYGKKGNLARAFPSYLLLICDDGGEWLDARKLWSNFYIYRSVIDISVFQESSQPVHTATLKVTNVYHNLNKAPKARSIQKAIEEDPEYIGIQKWWYKLTGSLLGTPKLTQTMVDVKNQLFDNINMKTGARIHLRMGYGSNPAMMPICFNGTIAEMDVGDIVTIIAQSDGVELVNSVISTDENEKNKLTKLQSEPSDIIASLVTDRHSYWNNVLSPTWGEKNKYGLEHYGIYTGHQNLKHKEYDTCKNIYYGKYNCKPYCQNIFGPGDGEANINFFLFNKTPWDIMQITAQALPEFICQPIYHGFESRIFYGLPVWTAKYKYDFLDDGRIFEYAKPYSQFHYLDSMSDIIDNQIKVSSQDLNTNVVAMFTQGSNMVSTPIIFSDKSIDWSMQKTKIIDTSVVQDYVGWDWLYAHLPVLTLNVGKSAAIKIAISNIIDGWNKSYLNPIIILGESCIKPHDKLFINDNYADMRGICIVREVVHSMSVETGYVTSITPSLIATNNMNNSGMNNVHKTLISCGTATAAVYGLRFLGIQAAFNIGGALGIGKVLNYIEKSGTFFKGAKSMSTVAYDAIKTGRIVSEFAEVTGEIKIIGAAARTVAGAKEVGGLVDGIKLCMVMGGSSFPLVGNIVMWLVAEVVFDVLLVEVMDKFQYNNSISLTPLIYKGQPFVSGCKGYSKLIPGFKDSDENIILG